MAKEGDSYYVFCTGPGIPVRSSTDRINWNPPHKALDPVPSWTATTIPGSREFYWAPDVTYFDHKWHLYYAVSTFGRNRSAIGLATNQTLDPSSPNYKWIDEGPAVQSYPTDNFNAIDPHVALDEHGHPWMTFGSFWSGIKLLQLDVKTGKPSDPNQPPISLAFRPREQSPPDAIEAPFIYRHGRSFYLFASYDFCCRGVRSTYNIRVGRASQIAGPYVDRDGVPMLNGGGTSVIAGGDRWKGPGHNCVIHDQGRDYLVYHAYDANANGLPTLRISELDWDHDGWPVVAARP
jgi:arabinan endo-1,5-alpha-L-arabinosidase